MKGNQCFTTITLILPGMYIFHVRLSWRTSTLHHLTKADKITQANSKICLRQKLGTQELSKSWTVY